MKSKAADFFAPHLFRVACPFSAEMVIHGLSDYMEGFVVLSVNMMKHSTWYLEWCAPSRAALLEVQ